MDSINFCSQCGHKTNLQIPLGDNRQRAVCSQCGHIHYQNPNPVCGAILTWEDKVLLCKRAIEPQLGKWTLPAGFMEINETPMQAAARESYEEAYAQSPRLELFSIYTFSRIGHVNMIYRGELSDGYAKAGPESQAVNLYDEKDIPWDELAFTVMTENLKRFFEDRKNGQWQLHQGEIEGNLSTGWRVVNYQAN